MKPVIAIISTSGEDKNKPYVDTIEFHQGHSILLKEGDDFKAVHPQGILLTGGGDLNEIHYDHAISENERKTLGQIEPNRDAYETQLLTWATANDIPTLGICRGCQVLNVFSGGTLIPDIPTWQKQKRIKPVLKHRFPGDSSAPAHTIRLEAGSILSSIFGHSDTIDVNSSHHQALQSCGPSLRITARSADGIIEAIENPNKEFWLGVQFHPERMWKRFPIFSRLFQTFMERARQRPL
jgi:putative glutamine amidotransferase